MNINRVDPEVALVGCWLIDDRSFEPSLSIGITEKDFHIDVCRDIFRVCLMLLNEGIKPELQRIMDRGRDLRMDISNEFIAQAMDITTSASMAEEYTRMVIKESQRRKLASVAEYITSADGDPNAVIAAVQDALEDIQTDVSAALVGSVEALMHLMDGINDRESGRRNYVPTGYSNLDATLGGGMINSGLYIMAARPGVGKTMVAMNIADQIDGPVLVISLEMSPDLLTARRLARESGVPTRVIAMSDKLTKEQWEKISSAAVNVSLRKVVINRKPAATVSSIGVMARSVKGLRCIIIDYLGLIASDTGSTDTYQKTTEVSNGLKKLAMSLDVPILCLAQLNRESEKRSGKKPSLSDLRDSGAIEQDADAVLLLHIPQDDTPQEEKNNQWYPTVMELNVAKNRHAGTGEIRFNCYQAVSIVKEVK